MIGAGDLLKIVKAIKEAGAEVEALGFRSGAELSAMLSSSDVAWHDGGGNIMLGEGTVLHKVGCVLMPNLKPGSVFVQVRTLDEPMLIERPALFPDIAKFVGEVVRPRPRYAGFAHHGECGPEQVVDPSPPIKMREVL